MEFDGITKSLGKLGDQIGEGVTDSAALLQKSTERFHEQYILKLTPNLGKFNGLAKFAAELAPGVTEYNAIKAGDWIGFATAAGIDIGAAALGTITGGTGFMASKGGSLFAKSAVKSAVKEVAESGGKQTAKELGETGVKHIFKGAADAVGVKASGSLEKNAVKSKTALPVIESVKAATTTLTDKFTEKLPMYSKKIAEYAAIPPTQLAVLKSQHLIEGMLDGHLVLKARHIDLNLKTERLIDGVVVKETNLQRMKRGLAPIGRDGRPMELHHIGQHPDSPLAELESTVHRSNAEKLNRSNDIPTEIDRVKFAKQRADHWKARAAEIEKEITHAN